MQKIYEIQSFSTAWSIAIANFSAIVGVSFVLGAFVIGGGYGFFFILGWIVLAGIQSYYIFIANKSYKIDIEAGTIIVPKSGYGQTGSWSFSVDFYWNLMKKQTINIDEIEDVVVDTKRWETANEENTGSKKLHVIYQLNIIGSFGNAFFKFKSGEKRNEISNAICQAVKEVTGKELSCKDDYKPGRADKTLDSILNNF
jgi:hypothetical protein